MGQTNRATPALIQCTPTARGSAQTLYTQCPGAVWVECLHTAPGSVSPISPHCPGQCLRTSMGSVGTMSQCFRNPCGYNVSKRPGECRYNVSAMPQAVRKHCTCTALAVQVHCIGVTPNNYQVNPDTLFGVTRDNAGLAHFVCTNCIPYLYIKLSTYKLRVQTEP